MKKKKQHGGARENSGRKKKEPTVVVRIPASKVKEVKKLISKYQEPYCTWKEAEDGN